MIKDNYKPIPFWSWNDKLEEKELLKQIDWMHENGIGGFFIHARSGLQTPYLSDEWFSLANACIKRANELDMSAYAYDDNGWPSGFVGGELLKEEDNKGYYLEHSYGEYDENAYACYDVSKDEIAIATSGKNVLRVYLKRSNGNVDILNEKVVQKFINATHARYKKNDVYSSLKGFFTDEPQFPDGGHPYSIVMEEYFQKNYHEDIKKRLGLLFSKQNGYEEFRYKFWNSMNDLIIHSYGEQIHNWCQTNNYQLTGHYYEETVMWLQNAKCGDIMPLYRYMDIPGVDWLGRFIQHGSRSDRLAASVAAQYDKKRVLCEMFAMGGWDNTPEELMHLAEYHMAGGVNLICHHLVPYSEHGERKKDHPIHFSIHNQWVKENFKEFNNRIETISKCIANSYEHVKVAVLYPIKSCYLNYDYDNMIESTKELEDDLTNTCVQLSSLHIPFHFLDETLLKEDGEVVGEKIKLGLMSYDYVVLPTIYNLDVSTDQMLQKYISQGGRVCLLGKKPTYLEGNKHSFDYLKSNITLEEIEQDNYFHMDENKDLLVTYRKDNDTKENFFYIVNLGDKCETTLNGRKLYFKKWESKCFFEKNLVKEVKEKRNVILLGKYFDLAMPVNNFLTLDIVSYSKDGIHYSEPFYYSAIMSQLIQEKYQGDIYLKYIFEVKSTFNKPSLLIENMNISSTYLNGAELKHHDSALEKDLWKYNVDGQIKVGLNEVIIKINFYEDEPLCSLLFEKNAPTSLLNLLSYKTSIEPIYVMGEFGVFGDFIKGNEPYCYLGKGFYIDRQKQRIESMILDGFPFFNGKMEVTQSIYIADTNSILRIKERFQLVDVEINDMPAGRMMLEHYLDISPFLKKGDNKVKLTIYASNRNMLGPHHCKNAEEEKAVSPYSFDFKGSWDEGKSDNFREDYSFVKNII